VGRPNRKAERREEILDAAIALIERHDLATLRIADVAAELGLTANAVRYYFKEMDQLLAQLALRSDTRFYDERLAVVERTRDVREQLALTIAAGLPTGPEDAEWRSIWRAVLAAATSRRSTTGRSACTRGYSARVSATGCSGSAHGRTTSP
jgi:AcrR family transcriptional regulator